MDWFSRHWELWFFFTTIFSGFWTLHPHRNRSDASGGLRNGPRLHLRHTQTPADDCQRGGQETHPDLPQRQPQRLQRLPQWWRRCRRYHGRRRRSHGAPDEPRHRRLRRGGQRRRGVRGIWRGGRGLLQRRRFPTEHRKLFSQHAISQCDFRRCVGTSESGQWSKPVFAAGLFGEPGWRLRRIVAV